MCTERDHFHKSSEVPGQVEMSVELWSCPINFPTSLTADSSVICLGVNVYPRLQAFPLSSFFLFTYKSDQKWTAVGRPGCEASRCQ